MGPTTTGEGSSRGGDHPDLTVVMNTRSNRLRKRRRICKSCFQQKVGGVAVYHDLSERQERRTRVAPHFHGRAMDAVSLVWDAGNGGKSAQAHSLAMEQ